MLVVSAAVGACLVICRLPAHSCQEGMRLRLGETIKVAHRGRQGLLLKPKICCHQNTTVYVYSGESTAKSKMRKPYEIALKRAFQGIFVLQKLMDQY